MKIITYNVNGFRAAISKGFLSWLESVQPDVVCLQEIKAEPDQLPLPQIEKLGYHHYWHPAWKKGYSGVAILSKQKPVKVTYGCGIRDYDCEGRVLRADLDNLSVMSVYHPSGTTGDERQEFKMRWLSDFRSYVTGLKKEVPGLVISGDFNICHKAIDIHNPVANARSSGFLPEERAWMDSFLDTGFIDTFRVFDGAPHRYTWWTYRLAARARNLGWRIDYHMASESLFPRLKGARILSDACHSDHCPVELIVD